MIKILLVEDEANIRKILAYDLKKSGYDVSECEDGEMAIILSDTDSFDVFIVDWMLPKCSGIDLVEHLRSQDKDAIIIMLTARDEERDILYAFEKGVDDYISKPFSPKEVCARVQAHVKRQNKHVNKRIMIGNFTLDYSQRSVNVNNKPLLLTKKEYDLLCYFLNNKQIVCSRDQILNDIWGFDYDGDTRIVDVHVFKLRAKLENADVHIHSSRGIGYILKESNHD